jgi:hypothetical protein
LLGLKENVIIGKLIPAGTGMARYRTIRVEPTERPERLYPVPATDFDESPLLEEGGRPFQVELPPQFAEGYVAGGDGDGAAAPAEPDAFDETEGIDAEAPAGEQFPEAAGGETE